MTNVNVVPQKVMVGEVEWSAAEVKELKEIFDGKNSHTFNKRDVRDSALLQKALRCEVIATPPYVQYGEQAVIYVAKAGLELMAAFP